MTTALVPHGGREEISREQIDLLKRTICAGSTDDELAMFVQTAQRLHLDPFARQVFAVKRWDSRAKREVMAIQVSIDGFRLVAERTGKYAGQLGPFWCGDDGEWKDVWLSDKPPAAAKVGVLRHDFKEPVWSVATWASYKQTKNDGGLSPMWFKFGPLMLGKCAEGLSLRRAFPNELSDVYSPEEMAQATPAEPADPEYTPPKASAEERGPKAPSPPRSAPAETVTTASASSASGTAAGVTRASAPAPADSTAPSGPKTTTTSAASIRHDGNYITDGQLKVLHITRREVGGQYCTDGGKDEDDARSLWRSKVLSVYRDKDGERITSSKQLSKAQANHLIDRLTRYAERTRATLAARDAETNVTDIIPINREPGADDVVDEEMATPDDLDALGRAAADRWGDSYKEVLPEWLQGAFDYSTVMELRKQEAIDAARMIRSGK